MTRSILSPDAGGAEAEKRTGRSGISFATADATLRLTEILLELNPALAADAFTVTLYGQSAGKPAELVATLGTISQATIPRSAAGRTEIPIAASIMLQPHTDYWVELADADAEGKSARHAPRPARAVTPPPGNRTISVKDHRPGRQAGTPAIRRRRTGALQGRLDTVSPHCIAGWARALNAPDQAIDLQILDNGTIIGRVTADRYRDDLAQAGLGDGHCGFVLHLDDALSPQLRHVIQAQWVANGQDLPGSPWTIEPAPNGAPKAGPYRGQLDDVTRERVTGWVLDRLAPHQPVLVEILADGQPIGRVLADRYRADLVQAGVGLGCYGFDFAIAPGLLPSARHVITVRHAGDGTELPGSPATIEAANGRSGIVPAARSAADDQDPIMAVMMAQAERLADDTGAPPKPPIQGGVQRRAGIRPGPGWRALVLDERMPAISRDAGSVAICSHMQALQRLGYAVSFAATQKAAPAPALTDWLDAAGISHFGASTFGSVEDIIGHHAGCFDVVYLYRAGVASRCLALTRACDPKARILYSVGDLHHLRLQRQAAIEDRPALLTASSRMRLAEFMAALSADAVITHSADEAAILRQAAPQVPVHSIPWDVPARATTVPFTDRSGLAFVGHYGYAPNEDAACWLVETVMPLVWQIDPNIRCLLAGSDMTARVRQLARPGIIPLDPAVDLHADVFDQVRLSVAPLRYGAGLTGKVLQSLAAGIPCVMSRVAAAGLNPTPPLQALIGGDAAALAAQIVHLHADAAANSTLAKAGLSFIGQNFTADHVTAGLRAAIAGRDPAADTLVRIA